MTETRRVKIALMTLNSRLEGPDGQVWTVRTILDAPPEGHGKVKVLDAIDSHRNVVVLERRVAGSRYEQRALRASSLRNSGQWKAIVTQPLRLVAG